MKTVVVLIAIIIASSTLLAQPGSVPPPIPPPASPQMPPVPPNGPDGMMMAGRTMENQLKSSYADSAEFAKYFKELYATIGPKKSVRSDAKDYLGRMSRSFAMQGIDSAKADSVAYAGLDTNAYRNIYFQAYRKNLTAVELKKYVDFIKTPEGQKVSEVMPQLQRAPAETNGYISRLISTNLASLRRASYEKMQKEHPPSQRQTPPHAMQGNQMGNPDGAMQPPQLQKTPQIVRDSTVAH